METEIWPKAADSPPLIIINWIIGILEILHINQWIKWIEKIMGEKIRMHGEINLAAMRGQHQHEW